MNPSTKRLCRHGEFELNDMLWDWFQKVRSKNLPCSGPMLQQKAMEFAKVLGRTEFKASNGWLEAFKKRHKLGQRVLCGESASVDESLVSDWNSLLISHIEGYDTAVAINIGTLYMISFLQRSCVTWLLNLVHQHVMHLNHNPD